MYGITLVAWHLQAQPTSEGKDPGTAVVCACQMFIGFDVKDICH